LAEPRADAGNRHCGNRAGGLWRATQLRDERRELPPNVVPNDEVARLDVVGKLLRHVLVERMHHPSPPSEVAIEAFRRAPRPRPCSALRPVPAGVSSKLFSAAFTAGDVRSRTSSSTLRVGISRAVHFSLAPSTQNTSSRPWAMARLRSVTHFGTTRSGQRCI